MRSDTASISPGVTIFGTAIIEAPADRAVIKVAVSRVEKTPQDAFAGVRKAGASIVEFLAKGQFGEFGTSRITLSEEKEWTQSKPRFVGYQARLAYTVKLADLDRTEEVLSGVVAAGANEVSSVTFETSRMEELRAEARKKAVGAARMKAEVFSKEAGVSLGRVIAVQDKNPESTVLGEREFLTGGGTGQLKAIDPTLISVGASVFLTYEIAGG